MRITFTLFIGFTLLFAAINFAQQPSPYPPNYQPASAQPLQPRLTTTQPTIQPNTSAINPSTQNPIQSQPNNSQPLNARTLQTKPMLTPPKSITTNGTVTYQPPTNQPTTPTPGFNSPFPTNLAQPTPAPSTQPQYQPNQPNQTNRPNPNQPHVASDGRYLPAGGGNGNNITTNNQGNFIRTADASGLQNLSADRAAVGVANTGTHVGRAAPAVRVHPFVLKPEEQRELDDFLLRWEKYSETVNNYGVDFNAFFYDPTNPLSPPVTSSDPQLKPMKIMFGSFSFVAPKKFVYHVEGEWLKKERIKYIDPEVTPNVTAEKTIIDGQSLYFYDFPAKKVVQYRMPPEVMNRTIANGPFPLIFGAKAVDMKKRFSMKIVTNPDYRDKEIWLWAVPLLPEDQQEFVKIEIRLDKRTMNAMALKRIDPNEKSYTTYTLQNPKINKIDILGLGNIFNPTIPRGWKHEIQDQTQAINNPNLPPNASTATTINYPQPTPQPTLQPRTELKLYTP
ncbi:MAG: hypothetical protein LBK06_10900 [Planctomycetaceae bacterium]|nr:hypothetical protein [Planctomycetaceae bacterium]